MFGSAALKSKARMASSAKSAYFGVDRQSPGLRDSWHKTQCWVLIIVDLPASSACVRPTCAIECALAHADLMPCSHFIMAAACDIGLAGTTLAAVCRWGKVGSIDPAVSTHCKPVPKVPIVCVYPHFEMQATGTAVACDTCGQT